MYAATANVPPPPKLKTTASTSRAKAVVNKPFTYKASAKNMESYLETLTFRMQLPAGTTLAGFHSSPKLSTRPAVDEDGMMTWVTPLQSEKTVRPNIKLTSATCDDNVPLVGQWYKADFPIFATLDVPLKKPLMITGPECPKPGSPGSSGGACTCSSCKCGPQGCNCASCSCA